MGHQQSAKGGGVGFLRSCPVPPGTLPTEATSWETCCGRVLLGTHVHFAISVPILTLHASPGEQDDTMAIHCTSMSGQDLLLLHVSLGRDCLADLRSMIVARCTHKPQLALPDGRFLPESDDASLLASLFHLQPDESNEWR